MVIARREIELAVREGAKLDLPAAKEHTDSIHDEDEETHIWAMVRIERSY